MGNVISMSKKKAELKGEVPPDVLVDNLRRAIEEGTIESVVYITKGKDGAFTIGHSTLLSTEVIGFLEIGKQLIIENMYE